MEEVWQRDTQISRQRKRLPEVPKSPPTVLPANLQTMSCQLEVSQTELSQLTREMYNNYDRKLEPDSYYVNKSRMDLDMWAV